MSTSEEILKKVSSVLWAEADVRFGCVYGSVASGRVRARSDVDIAIAGKSAFPFEYRLRLGQRLESILQREIDILDLQNCDGLVQYQALTKGVIVKSDPAMWEHLSRQALFFQADMLPQIRKARLAKVQRFVHGL